MRFQFLLCAFCALACGAVYAGDDDDPAALSNDALNDTAPDEATGNVGESVTESNAADAEARAISDEEVDRWTWRAASAGAAVLGGATVIVVFAAIRIALGAALTLGMSSPSAERRSLYTSLHTMSLVSYLALPALIGIGAGLFVWPFSDETGALLVGVMTTGAIALSGVVGAAIGLGLGLALGGFLAASAVTAEQSELGVLFLVLGVAGGVMIGSQVGIVALAPVAGLLAAATSGGLVGKHEPLPNGFGEPLEE